MILRRDFLKSLIAAPVALSIPLPLAFLAQDQAALPQLYENTRIVSLLLDISTTGVNNEFLHQIVLLAPHKIESVNTIFLDGIKSEDARFADHVTIKNYLGYRPQSVSYSYVVTKWNPVLFSTGIPQITADICGEKINSLTHLADYEPAWQVYQAGKPLDPAEYIDLSSDIPLPTFAR